MPYIIQDLIIIAIGTALIFAFGFIHTKMTQKNN
jgi:hypothetical protein